MILSIETSLGSGSCTAQRSIAIAYIVDTLLFNLDENKINGMVFVDYKKAFDMVDHATLLSKLGAYNLDKNALLWLKSYLADHTQLVSLMGQSSSIGTVTAGVSQGSMLGPLLFVVLSMIYPNMSILRSTYLLITPLFWRLPILLFCLMYMLWFNFILNSNFISLCFWSWYYYL